MTHLSGHIASTTFSPGLTVHIDGFPKEDDLLFLENISNAKHLRVEVNWVATDKMVLILDSVKWDAVLLKINPNGPSTWTLVGIRPTDLKSP